MKHFNNNRFVLLGITLMMLALYGFSGSRQMERPATAAETLDLREIDGGAEVVAAPKPNSAATPTPLDTPSPKMNEDSVPKPKQNFLVWMVQSLGLGFTILFLCISVTMVAVGITCVIAIRQEELLPTLFLKEFEILLNEKKYQDAYNLACENNSFIAKILSAGLKNMSKGYDQAVEAMQEVGEEETIKIENRLKILSIIGNVAPMLGLFGTVMGMIEAFQTIAGSISAPPAFKLAEGISTALFHTEAGLALAIPSIAFYDVMRNRFVLLVHQVGMSSFMLMKRFRTKEQGKQV